MNTFENIHSQEEKNQLAKTLSIVCALQKQFGKTTAEFELFVEGFSRVLHHYPMKIIIQSIDKYILKNNDIPTPADIENIINPPPPRIDWAYYVSLKKKIRDGNYYIDPDERKFLKNCEDLAIIRQRGEMEEYLGAQQQLQHWQSQQITSDYE